MKRSRFVYDRSLANDLADILASARANTWCDPQRFSLDLVIRAFMDIAYESDQQFDTEHFARRAKYWTDRQPTAAPPE